VTPDEIQVPNASWRNVPLAEVSGVALARDVPIKGSRRGQWCPTFWRLNGDRIVYREIGFTTSKTNPSGTKPAVMILGIYNLIVESQGPNGPLVEVATQRHPALSGFDSIEKIWDPAQHR
jgi:hypothetical protein